VPGLGVVVGGGGSQRSQINLPSRPEYTKITGFPYFLPHLLFLHESILLRHLFKNTIILKFFVTYSVVELYLFKVSEVIYAPSHPD
jgi:hypothetical protein